MRWLKTYYEMPREDKRPGKEASGWFQEEQPLVNTEGKKGFLTLNRLLVRMLVFSFNSISNSWVGGSVCLCIWRSECLQLDRGSSIIGMHMSAAESGVHACCVGVLQWV